jgi:hypothetical protein
MVVDKMALHETTLRPNSVAPRIRGHQGSHNFSFFFKIFDEKKLFE